MANRFARDAWRRHQLGDLADETAISQEIVTRIRFELPKIMPTGFRLQARCFQSSGAKLSGAPGNLTTEEALTGADLLVVLRTVTRVVSACSGFIAQAKLLTKLTTSQEWSRFIAQAAAMESLAPGLGYGSVYAGTSRLSPAGLIAGLPSPGVGTRLPASLVWRQHFREFFAGRIGDVRACDLLRTGFIQGRRQEAGLAALLQGRPVIAVDLMLTDTSSEDARANWIDSERAAGLDEMAADSSDTYGSE